MSDSPVGKTQSDSDGRGSSAGRWLTRLVWLLVVGSLGLLVASFVVTNRWIGVLSVIVAGGTAVLVGFLQSRAVVSGMSSGGPTATSSANPEVVKVLLAEYAEVRTTRNLASESGARLFQYYQIAIIASFALILPYANADPLGLAKLPSGVHSALLALAAFLLSMLAADILHWHLDVMTLEDYQERVLRPRLSAELGDAVLQGEKHLATIRRYGGWSRGSLGDLTEMSWVDPFVLKELGHVLVLGLPGLAVATYAYWQANFDIWPVLLAAAVGIYCASVWASYWSAAFAYVTWHSTVLKNAWKAGTAAPKQPAATSNPHAGFAHRLTDWLPRLHRH